MVVHFSYICELKRPEHSLSTGMWWRFILWNY